jgi:hypothetical protein
LDPPLEIRADSVQLDARAGQMEVSGDVAVDSPPFHLRSDRLRIWRSPRGVRVEGDTRLAFCPCLGAPLTLELKGATVAPPGDLLLDRPRLELYSVPILWLPFLWLRAPDNVGLLPLDLAYRGADGVFLGAGVHMPWTKGDPRNGLDLRAGGYVLGGVAVDAKLRTPHSMTDVRVDDLKGEVGFAVDARGAVTSGPEVAWDVDAIRGTRGVVSTTDFDAASRVFDHAAAEATWRSGGWTVATGVLASNVRGTSAADLGAAGPVLEARRGEALGSIGAYDVRVEGGGVAGAARPTTSFARTGGGLLVATRAGSVRLAASARGVADVGASGSTDGADAAGTLRAEASLPLGLALASGDLHDPWVHVIEPHVAVSGLASRGDEVLGYLPSAGGVAGLAWVAGGGVTTSLGQWGSRRAFSVSADAGALGQRAEDGPVLPVVRWRAQGSDPWVGLGAEGAHVLSKDSDGTEGSAVVARARVGRLDGLHVAALVAGRDGVDPIAARALTDAPLEPSSGLLAATGWTGGARLGVPLGPYVRTQAGADADLTSRELLAVRGSVEFRDKCGCLAIRAIAAERLGRPGVDVWVTIDLVPSR